MILTGWKLLTPFTVCSNVVLFALASVVVCFVYSLAWATVLGGGTFKRTLEIRKKTETKTSKPYLCRCLKLVFFGSQVQGKPVNVKIQNKEVRIDFLLSFDSQWENCENLLLLSFLDGRLPLRNNFYTCNFFKNASPH